MNFNELRKHLVYLNKEFIEGEVYKLKENITLDKKVIKANLLITGFGMYDIYLNSSKVGQQFFKPGFSQYNKRVLFQEYDVLDLLKENNILEIYVAQGWYSGRFFCENTVQNFGTLPSISYILEILYEDNSSKVFTSYPHQKTYISEYDYAGIYDGEVIDFSKENLDKELGELEIKEFPNEVEIQKTLTEVTLNEEVTIKNITSNDDGTTIIDFGQNFAGVISINTDLLSKGQQITIRHGELLTNEGKLYTSNLRKAKATIIYKKGDEKGIYTPRFTYMGFRYIELKGIEYKKGLVKAHALYTNMQRLGEFQCDNVLVNKLYSNLNWSQKSNYVEVPTDCPQRDERMGYTGDGHVFALTGSYNYDTLDFWKNFFADVTKQQLDNPDGNIAPYVPCPKPRPVGFITMQGWGSAISIIPETMYNQYGDEEFFKNQYDAMKKYIDLEISKAGPKYLWKGVSLGDWLSLRKGMAWQAINNAPVSNAFFVNDLRIFLRLLKLMNKEDEYKHYEEIYQKVKNAYIKAFINKKNGKVKKDYQGTYVLALKHVLIEDSTLKKLVQTRFVENVKKYGLDTGFFATEFLLPMLVESNETKLAYDILLSDKCPGWMYQINKGATTIWERWDSLKDDGQVNESQNNGDNMVSFNHYSFGAVGEFFYQYILGIKALEPGYTKIKIQPYPDKRLGNVKGSYLSRSGKIVVNYFYFEDKIKFEIEVPTSTLIILPNGEEHNVEQGKYEYLIKE
jgi:alpha-L-rhamnosidase